MTRAIEILLAEDDPGDVRLTREALKTSKLALRLSVVENGEEALSFLRREGKFKDAPRPDLIMLDLNMPRCDGREVLRAVKTSPELRSIPVCVVTTSENAKDINDAYALGVNCYVTKPIDLDQFMRVVQAIESFWMTIVKLPTRSSR
jgi:two-component system, chemotaxis family, response regulator Rcp1